MRPQPPSSQALRLGLLVFTSTTAAAAAEEKAAQCYFLDGTVSHNSWPCDNSSTTAHSTCCPPGATCYSNGVCEFTHGGVPDFLRVGCTDKTWNDAACLRRCTDDGPTHAVGIRPCDGISQGTHYCCDDGKSGTGSYACCQDAAAVFVLGNAIPTVLAVMPFSTPTSSSSSSSPTSTSHPPPTKTPNPSPTPKPASPSSHTTLGIGIGIGIGIPLAAATIGFLVWRVCRARRRGSGGGTFKVLSASAASSSTAYGPVHAYRAGADVGMADVGGDGAGMGGVGVGMGMGIGSAAQPAQLEAGEGGGGCEVGPDGAMPKYGGRLSLYMPVAGQRRPLVELPVFEPRHELHS